MSRLVDKLVANRVLLADKAETGTAPLLRLAHQRVLESWSRASAIVDEQQDFFRIREDVEQQHRRWREGGERLALLIPPGVALAEAEKIAADYRNELSSAVVAFVARSGRRARVRQSLFASAAVVFAIVAAVAAFEWFEADKARVQAVATYQSAKGTVDKLIASFTGRLSLMKEVSLDTVQTAFKEIKLAVDQLGDQAAAIDPLFDKTRADLALAFAGTYKKKGDKSAIDQALELGEQSLALRQQLAGQYPGNSELRWLVSKSHEFLSDVKRQIDVAAARHEIDTALAIRRDLVRFDPSNSLYAEGLSQILVRLGDMYREQKRFKDAAVLYEEALGIALRWFLARSGDATWQRELSWALSKVGTDRRFGPKDAWPEALAMFDAELCLRRRLLEGDPANKLIRADVTWSLERVSIVRQMLGDSEGAALAAYESLIGREALVDIDHEEKDFVRYHYRALHRASAIAMARGEQRPALAYLLQAEPLGKQLAEAGAWQRDLPTIEGQIAKLRSLLGPDSAAVEQGGPGIRAAYEATAKRRLEDHPARSSDCWEGINRTLQALAQSRGLVPVSY
jgi:hypothetical protein